MPKGVYERDEIYARRGKPHVGTKKPTKTASPIIREVIEAADMDYRAYITIAEEAGIYVNSLGVWKRGLAAPSIDNLEAVAQVLGYRLKLEKIDVPLS